MSSYIYRLNNIPEPYYGSGLNDKLLTIDIRKKVKQIWNV